MTRAQLEHIIRASADIAEDDEIVVIGSQAILGTISEGPADLLVSVEADVYPKNHPERADLIDGCIGEGSPFHETYGYYAQGVGEETATLPDGWKTRLVPFRTRRGPVGLCLEPHDLVIAKYVAGREKDARFVRAAIANRIVDPTVLRERLASTAIDDVVRASIEARMALDAKVCGC